MTRSTSRRAMELFDEVCDLPRDDRIGALDRLCAGDGPLRAELERMLDADSGGLGPAGLDPGEGAGLIAAELFVDGGSAPPDQIGRYRIIREIARGGMGIVYEAEQDAPRRRVALKVIREGFGSVDIRRRFRREVELIGRLQHPGVASIYEAGSARIGHTDYPYFAMEFVEGRRLDEHAHEQRLGTRDRVELMVSVCEAVQHAHQKGILHRDLKMANVLVRSGGGAAVGQPVVLDFGIACVESAGEDAAEPRTQAGQFVGTLDAMSPEQISGPSEQLDTRCDVYGLGVMLFTLLTGRPPLDLAGLPLTEACRVIREVVPPSLSSADLALRGDLEPIVAKCLEKDRERRYGTAGELATDLRRFLRNEPVAARPATTIYQIRRFARRNRALVTGAVLAAAALLLGTTVAAWYAVGEHRANLVSHEMLARANLSAAAAALRANDIETAERHLNATPLERRDWAWRHLASRLDQSLASAPIGDGEPAPGVNDYQRGSVSIWFALDGEPVYTARIARVGDTRRLLVEGRDPRTLECKSHWTLDGASFMLPDLRGDRLLVGERDGRLAERDAKSGAVLAGFDSPGEMPDRVWINGDSPGLAALEPVLDECTKPDSGVRVHATVDSATGHVIYQYRSDVWMEQLGDRSRINLPPHPEGFGWAAFSSDGRSVFTGGNDRRLMRIDLNGGARIAWTRDNAHTDAILAGAVAPDGAYIATGGQDGVFRFWDTPEGKPLGAWIGHRKPILAVAVSPDGGSIVSASADRVYRWSVDFRSPPNVLWRHDWFVQHLAMSPDGSLLAAAGRGAIAVFDVSTGLKLAEYPDIDANANILTFAFSPDGRGLLLWSRINKGRYIDLMAGQVRAWPRFDPPAMDPRYAEISLTNAVWEDPIERFALESATSPSGLVDVPSRTFVLVSPPERTLRVFRGEGIAGAWPIDLPLRFPLAFIDTGPSVVVATQDDRALMFNVGTGKVVGSFDGHTGTVTAAAVLEPGRLLVTGSEDRTIRLWDIPHRRELAELRGHLDTVRAIAVAPNGKTFFSASDDYTVRRWSTLSDAELARERVAHALASDRLRPEVDAILADDPDAAHAADRLAALADLTAREKAIGFQLLIQRAAERVPSRREQNRLHESAFDRP